MKSKDLIAKLQEFDPTGETEVVGIKFVTQGSKINLYHDTFEHLAVMTEDLKLDTSELDESDKNKYLELLKGYQLKGNNMREAIRQRWIDSQKKETKEENV